MEKIKASKSNVNKIVTALKNGAVLISPTDTIYGFICDAGNKKAVEKIFEIKRRDKAKPLGIFVKDTKTAEKFAFVNKEQEDLLENSKVTVILKSKKKALSKLVYKGQTIGIRIPDYKLLNVILNKFGRPVAQTSANLSEQLPITKISEIIEYFKKEDIIIIDGGDLPKREPSKVIDSTNKEINIIRN